MWLFFLYSPKDSTASEHSTARSTRGRSRSTLFEDVMVNDYNSFPQNVQLETVKNNEENSSQIANEETDPPNNSVYVNACIKPNILTSNNIYDVIGDINPALK
nr:hypothetical protein BgiMline_009587 [Biomphalaria glabrata]